VKLAVLQLDSLLSHHDGGVVKGIAGALAEAPGDVALVLSGEAPPAAHRRPLERLRQRFEALAVGDVPGHDHLGQQHDVGPVREGAGCRLLGQQPVTFGRIGIPRDLRERDRDLARHP
jgi:hypothetical protein